MSIIKNNRLVVFMLALILFAAACDRARTPETTARNFLNALSDGDYERAKEFATQESHQQLDMLQDGEQPNIGRDFTIIGLTDETDTTAVVTYRWEDDPNRNLNLVRRDNEWLVAFSKMDDMDLEQLLRDLEMEDDEFLENDTIPMPGEGMDTIPPATTM